MAVGNGPGGAVPSDATQQLPVSLPELEHASSLPMAAVQLQRLAGSGGG
jgi:hypothetical protein